MRIISACILALGLMTAPAAYPQSRYMPGLGPELNADQVADSIARSGVRTQQQAREQVGSFARGRTFSRVNGHDVGFTAERTRFPSIFICNFSRDVTGAVDVITATPATPRREETVPPRSCRVIDGPGFMTAVGGRRHGDPTSSGTRDWAGAFAYPTDF